MQRMGLASIGNLSQKAAELCGIAGKHTSHSLRKTGATISAQANIPSDIRQRHGMWKSAESMLTYDKPSEEQRLTIPKALHIPKAASEQVSLNNLNHDIIR